jgi:hypothetical protein
MMVCLLAGLAMAPAMADDALVSAATPIVDKLMNAMATNNYEQYVQPWDPAMNIRTQLTKEAFSHQCQQTKMMMGAMKSKSFYSIVDFSQGGQTYKVVQWKASFEKSPQPLYIRLVLSKKEGKYLVAGHWVKNVTMEQDMKNAGQPR